MKKQLVAVLLMLGTACAARAQVVVPDPKSTDRNVAANFSAAPAASATVLQACDTFTVCAGAPFGETPASAFAFGSTAPDATPAPAPDPKFVYGGRDDFRWQLGIGVDWLRFRSSIFNASAVGVDSSVTYFTNEWFGVEGNVATGFAPEIFDREHVKLLIYGAGPKIALRQKKWEPWIHAIVGGAHEQPQTADNSKNAFAVEAGGGADYRINPRFSGRLEADWVHTGFFGQSQNNFKLMAGVVFHF
jgi:opacity protein-like surface antigen